MYLTSVQFILQLKLYTIMRLLSEEFKISLKSYTGIMSHNKS